MKTSEAPTNASDRVYIWVGNIGIMENTMETTMAYIGIKTQNAGGISALLAGAAFQQPSAAWRWMSMTKLRVTSHALESKLLKGGYIWEYSRVIRGDTRS